MQSTSFNISHAQYDRPLFFLEWMNEWMKFTAFEWMNEWMNEFLLSFGFEEKKEEKDQQFLLFEMPVEFK